MTTLNGLDRPKRERNSPARLLEATVLDPPLTDDGWLRVEVDKQPGAARECPWVPRPHDEPLAGDAAVAMESDAGNIWVVSWWSPRAPGDVGEGTRFFMAEPSEYEADGYRAWAVLAEDGSLTAFNLWDEGDIERDDSGHFAVGPIRPSGAPLAWFDTGTAQLFVDPVRAFRDAGAHFYVGPNEPDATGVVWLKTGGPDLLMYIKN